MTEQWQELKETITEMRDNDGTGTQREICKFLADYMETLEKQMQEPTEKCKGCYYNDGDTHAECVVCDKEAQPTDEVKCDCATEEIANSFIEDVEAVEDQLEAQPCEDCISRAKALDTLKTSFLGMSFERYKKAKRMFEQLPSVTPKYTDEEIDKAQAVEQAYVDKMVELAVEEMKRPKGKWIEIEIDAGEFIYKCTKCGMRVINPYKYCPICGSYNGGEKE